MKNEEIKEILKDLFKDENVNGFILSDERYIELKYYITSLQQENENLKQTLHNITINGVEEENTSVLDLIKENERLKENNQSYQEEMARTWKIADDYKSRCEKAIDELTYMSTDAYTDNYDIRDKHYNLLINILNGVDDK